MKRMIMLAVLCAFVFSAVAASAADIKAVAEFKSDAVWQRNWDFVDGNGDNSTTRTFDIAQRTELTFDFVANENLKAVFAIRVNQTWGRDGQAKVGNAPVDVIQVRKAYLDFMWPGTDVAVKAGFQGIAAPYAFHGSMILDSRAAALVVSKPVTDTVALTGAYIRAETTADAQKYLDFYALMADITAGDMNFKPFVIFGNAGQDLPANGAPAGMQNANATATKIDGAYWLGLASSMSFGEINVAADINYGNVSGKDSINDRSGWYLALSGEYAMDMMTPEAYFVYTSGEDDNANNGSERMPTIAKDWAIGSFFFGGDAWLNGSLNGGDAPLGFWALGVTLKDIQSFTDNLFHYATVIYAKGTNDKNSNVNAAANYGRALTEKDSMWEVDFNTYYKLYDALTIGLELGYVNLDADKGVWGSDGGSAYKVATGLKYKF
jgi:hypothetical protein